MFKFISSLFKNRQDKLCNVLDHLYQDINTINSTQSSIIERERLQLSDPTYTYGEIMPRSFGRLLELAEPQTNDVFYDLGSGNGKAVFTAALLYEWKKCYGIEFLPALHRISIELLAHFYHLPKLKKYFPEKSFNIEFIQEDFFDTDLSNANVIFINSTAFNITVWENLVNKLKRAQPGTRIIAISKKIDDKHFDKINESMLLQSWGMSSAFIYRRNEVVYTV